ncbi:MAG: SPW repeat protein [Actinomycetota bacterium]|nr:SPW repeat protein [Actinomycetota bacterium]
MAAPAVLGYSGEAAAFNDRAMGPIVVGASLVAVWQVMRPLRWFELVVGSWLLVAPWILYRWYETLPTANSLAVGLALIGLAFLGGKTTKNVGGGWVSVLPFLKREAREKL